MFTYRWGVFGIETIGGAPTLVEYHMPLGIGYAIIPNVKINTKPENSKSLRSIENLKLYMLIRDKLDKWMNTTTTVDIDSPNGKGYVVKSLKANERSND